MIIKRTYSTPAFLLIEMLIALFLLCSVSLVIVQYQVETAHLYRDVRKRDEALMQLNMLLEQVVLHKQVPKTDVTENGITVTIKTSRHDALHSGLKNALQANMFTLVQANARWTTARGSIAEMKLSTGICGLKG